MDLQNRNWREDSEIKGICCPSREPGFISQDPHGRSEASVTPNSNRFDTPPKALGTHVVQRHIHRQNTYTHKSTLLKIKKQSKQYLSILSEYYSSICYRRNYECTGHSKTAKPSTSRHLVAVNTVWQVT